MLHLYAIITRCSVFIFVIRQSKDSIVCSSKICQLRGPMLFFFFDPKGRKSQPYEKYLTVAWFEKLKVGQSRSLVFIRYFENVFQNWIMSSFFGMTFYESSLKKKVMWRLKKKIFCHKAEIFVREKRANPLNDYQMNKEEKFFLK